MVSFKSIYKSPDLTGEILCKPLKASNLYFDKKLEGSAGATKVALHVGKTVAAFFTGIIAAVGLLIKLCDTPFLKRHNDKQISEDLKEMREGLSVSEVHTSHNVRSARSGCEFRVVQDFVVSRTSDDAAWTEIATAVRNYSSQYRRLHLKLVGTNTAGVIEQRVQLLTQEPIARTQPAPATA